MFRRGVVGVAVLSALVGCSAPGGGSAAPGPSTGRVASPVAGSRSSRPSAVRAGRVATAGETKKGTADHRVKGAKYVALTFDDGPSTFTPTIAAILKKNNVPGTFFEIGQNVTKYPQYTRMLVSDGFPVENHTWDHANLTHLSAAKITSEIDSTSAVLKQNGATPLCVRAPYGAIYGTQESLISRLGYRSVLWSDDSLDWSRPGVSKIVSNAKLLANSNTTILFHDGGGDRSETVAALPTVISWYKSHGYRFTTACGPGALVTVRGR